MGVTDLHDLNIIELYFARDERAIKETEAKYGRLCYGIAYNILKNHEDSKECVLKLVQRGSCGVIQQWDWFCRLESVVMVMENNSNSIKYQNGTTIARIHFLLLHYLREDFIIIIISENPPYTKLHSFLRLFSVTWLFNLIFLKNQLSLLSIFL